MSGISSVGSSSLPNGGLSSVGASLLTTGAAPNPIPTAAPAPSTTSPLTAYQQQYVNLQQYDNQELLYASFLDPQDALANEDSVLQQAAVLLGSPGHPGTLATGTTSTPPASTATSSTSSSSSALSNLPSVSSILAASDSAAQQTLKAYANAPVGSSILDFQA